MGNKSKFLIAENPMVDDGRVFIVHTQSPLILAECFHCGADGDYTADAVNELKRRFEVGGGLEYSPSEYVVVGALWIEPHATDNPQRDADKLAGIMRRMADWYEAYLIWEDAQADLPEGDGE